jgi:hypothetical protein
MGASVGFGIIEGRGGGVKAGGNGGAKTGELGISNCKFQIAKWTGGEAARSKKSEATSQKLGVQQYGAGGRTSTVNYPLSTINYFPRAADFGDFDLAQIELGLRHGEAGFFGDEGDGLGGLDAGAERLAGVAI